MKLSNNCVVPLGLAETWAFLSDVERAAQCVPGVVDVAPDGDGRYRGILKARVGPMGVTLSGTVIVEEQNADAARARYVVDASDRRLGGGVRTVMAVQLTARSHAETELTIETDTTFIGRLAELGQPLIRRKAQSTIEEFAKNIAGRLARKE